MKARFLKILVVSFCFLFLYSLEVFSLTTGEIILLGRKADPRRIKKEQRAEQKKKEEERQNTPSENPVKSKDEKTKFLAEIYLIH